MSESEAESSTECDHDDAALVIRSREQKDVWGMAQVFECRDCGARWAR